MKGDIIYDTSKLIVETCGLLVVELNDKDLKNSLNKKNCDDCYSKEPRVKFNKKDIQKLREMISRQLVAREYKEKKESYKEGKEQVKEAQELLN